MQAVAPDNGPVERSAALDESLERAHRIAVDQGHPSVTLEHLLFALTDDPDASVLMAASNVGIDGLRIDVSGHIGRLSETLPPSRGGAPSPGQDLLRILQLASMAARQSQRRQVDGSIVLAAVIGDGNSPAAGLLKAHGLTFDAVIRALQRSQAPPAPPAPQPAQFQPDQAPEPRTMPVRPASTVPPPPSAEALLAQARARIKQSEPAAMTVRTGPTRAVAPVPEPAPVPPPAEVQAAQPTAVAAPVAPPAAVVSVAAPAAVEPAPFAPPPMPMPAQPVPGNIVADLLAGRSLGSDAGSNRPPLPPLPAPAPPPPPPVAPPQMIPPVAVAAPVYAEVVAPRAPAAPPPRQMAAAPPSPPYQQPTAPMAAPAPAAPMPPMAPQQQAYVDTGPRPPVYVPGAQAQPIPAYIPAAPRPQAHSVGAPGLGQNPALNGQVPHGHYANGAAAMPYPAPPMAPNGQRPAAPMQAPAPPPVAERIDIVAAAAGIPANLTPGDTTLIEITLPRASVDLARPAAQRSGQVPDRSLVRAASVRLTGAPAGAVSIEARTPETVWLDAASATTTAAEDLVWQFAVTPLTTGPVGVTLTVQMRTAGPHGVHVEAPQSETFDVVVKPRRGWLRKLLVFFGFALVLAAVAWLARDPIRRMLLAYLPMLR